ncbi:MAG: DUF4258 domain-containing protein [Desulfobaccales bacterium]
MKYKLSRHARLEMERRGISPELLEYVLQNPQQIVPEPRGKKAYQSIIDFAGKKFLLRAIVAEAADLPIVVTVYRTRKIHKYWRMP